jgi:hypothetical protein
VICIIAADVEKKDDGGISALDERGSREIDD